MKDFTNGKNNNPNNPNNPSGDDWFDDVKQPPNNLNNPFAPPPMSAPPNNDPNNPYAPPPPTPPIYYAPPYNDPNNPYAPPTQPAPPVQPNPYVQAPPVQPAPPNPYVQAPPTPPNNDPNTPFNPNLPNGAPFDPNPFYPPNNDPNDPNNNNRTSTGNGMNPGMPPQMPAQMTQINFIDSEERNSGGALEFLINYNEKFKQGDTTLFRDESVAQTLSILIGKNKANALLIGSAGVGKTRVVEDIAYRIANNDILVPQALLGNTVYELPLSNIVSGSTLVGQVEEKLKSVIDFATDPANKVILFIDEIHLLQGRESSYEKIAQILKPAMARGDMKLIGATTIQEAKLLHKDPAFNRRFSSVIIDEFTIEQTIEILLHAKRSFLNHYNRMSSLDESAVATAQPVEIDDELFPQIVAIADEFRHAGSHRPDNALTLLDRTIAEQIVARNRQTKNTDDVSIINVLQTSPIVISESHIKATALRSVTGTSKVRSVDIKDLKESFDSIKGQDHIIENIAKFIRVRELRLFPNKKPMTILFAGASGTGKTEVTKILADNVTAFKPIILNMTEFTTEYTITRILGSTDGYIGSESARELPFDSLETNPYKVILLDEFEKCHRAIQRLFMSAFDEGYITLANGKIVDFTRTIMIATTNASMTNDRYKNVGFKTNSASNKSKRADTVKDLSKYFDIELLNRFQHIETFSDLTEDVFKDILVNQYKTEVTRILKEQPSLELKPELDADDIELLAKEFIPEFGARPVSKLIRDFIEKQVL